MANVAANKYIVNTSKSADEAQEAVKNAFMARKFGVLHVYNLPEVLASKGFPGHKDCRIMDVCSPPRADTVLKTEMEMNMALPCRVNIFKDEKGQMKIGTIRPTAFLGMLSTNKDIKVIAEEVEKIMIEAIDEAAK